MSSNAKMQEHANHQEELAIELKNISKTYVSGKIHVKAIDQIDMNVKAGERLAVLGPSGSGKTTLLNLLGGITNPDQDEGYLRVFGEDIQDYSNKQYNAYRRDRIGFIFQFFNLFPALTAIENVVIGIDIVKREKKDVLNGELDEYEIAKSYLEKVGLGERLNHYPSQLSGGEQQRVAIARALAKTPFLGRRFLLLCDEPTGNLDTNTGDKIISLMKQLNDDIGITILMVTHNDVLASKFADRILHLEDGRIMND